MLPRVFRPEQSGMRNAQVEPFGMMNVDCEGNVSSFSPELLGLKHGDYGDFIVGNIRTDSLEEMLRSPPMSAMARTSPPALKPAAEIANTFLSAGAVRR